MKHRLPVVLLCLIFALAAAAQAPEAATIFEAAERGDIEAVTRLLKTDPKLIEAKNPEGETALHQAAGCRRGEPAALPIVHLLLDSGAVVDARNTGGQTPLLYASYAGFARVAELLVSRGAAVQYQDANGRSPVHYAAREGNPAVVEFLIKNGANLSLRDNQNRTPLDYAVLRDKQAVVETLLKLGRYDVKGAEGSTLLHAAASQGHADMVRSLIERGADPSRPGPNGDPILLSYLRGGLAGPALEEIAKGSDVNARDAAGRTALHLAVGKGLEDVAAALLNGGADPNAADKSGVVALDIARDWGLRPLAGLLTAKGARLVRPRAHLLKDGSYEIVDGPDDAKTDDAIIRYIGNDGFLIEAGSRAVLVDGLVRNPWGYTNTPERALEMMTAGRDPFGRLDLLLFSHAHRDHFEPRMALDVLRARPKASLAGDALVAGELREADPDAVRALGSRVMTLDVAIGERKSVETNGIPLTVLGVNHADQGAYLTLGYIMDLGAFRIYHQGDLTPPVNLPFLSSVPWEQMKIDIVFFDPFFLQDETARRIVLERIRPSVVILMHMREGESERYLAEFRPAVPQVLAYRQPMESKRFVKARR